MIPKSEARYLVVDDEALARERLRRLIGKHADAPIIEIARTGEETVQAIAEFEPHVVFLDIQLPDFTGFDVINAIGPEAMPPLIFVTAYDAYAIRAFEVQAVDYLVKPYTEERFQQALSRIHQRQQMPTHRATLDKLLGSLTELERRYLQRVLVRTRDGYVLVKVADIDWIEAENNYVRLHVGKESHLLREKLSALQARLDPAHFARIHRSTIVNLNRVVRLKPWFSGDYVVTLENGKEVRLSRTFREVVQRQLGAQTELTDS